MKHYLLFWRWQFLIFLTLLIQTNYLSVNAFTKNPPFLSKSTSNNKQYHNRHSQTSKGPSSYSLIFDELEGIIHPNELQKWMLTDLNRRRSELIFLGWLGRFYTIFPFLFQTLFPSVFKFQPYDNEEDVLFRRYNYKTDKDISSNNYTNSIIECVLKESSVVTRGVPIRIRFATIHQNQTTAFNDSNAACSFTIESVEVQAIGCDIKPIWSPNSTIMTAQEARDFCTAIQSNNVNVQQIVTALTFAIFHQLEPQIRVSLSKNFSLVPVKTDTVLQFHPRHDLFAREGLHEKWLQQISGYYFAESKLRNVYFDNSSSDIDIHDHINDDANATKNIQFTFYFDSMEPPNSIQLGLNVNPEILCCKFQSYGCY